MAVIETNQLTKYYKDCRGIEDLDLQVVEGEVFGFLGPNGAGKTTTIRLLLGLIRPTRGGFRIFDKPVNYHSFAYRENIGYLPGEVSFYKQLSGAELLARMASLRGKQETRSSDLAKRLQLDLSKKIQGLSHGNRQKLAIVQALMHDARLLILDEPTNGLDPLTQQTFFKLVREESERGAAVFLSSHVLAEVERACSRVGILRDGRLVTVEKIDDLKKKKMKHAEVMFGEDMDIAALRLPGARSIEIEERTMRFSIEGDYRGVLKALAACPVEDITIQDATLEDIFLEYYTGNAKEEP